VADGKLGYEKGAPYDAIHVGAAAAGTWEAVPKPEIATSTSQLLFCDSHSFNLLFLIHSDLRTLESYVLGVCFCNSIAWSSGGTAEAWWPYGHSCWHNGPSKQNLSEHSFSISLTMSEYLSYFVNNFHMSTEIHLNKFFNPFTWNQSSGAWTWWTDLNPNK